MAPVPKSKSPELQLLNQMQTYLTRSEILTGNKDIFIIKTKVNCPKSEILRGIRPEFQFDCSTKVHNVIVAH